MTQIIEYAKIRDVILIYHFEFDRNGQIPIGDHFACSINKYMCLNDWLAISQALTDCIDACLSTKLTPKPEDIPFPNQNIAMVVDWIKLDPIYTRLAKPPTAETIHPFVMKLNITTVSSANRFCSTEPAGSTEFACSIPAPTMDAKHTQVITEEDMKKSFAHYNLDAFVALDRLDVDKYIRDQHSNEQSAATIHSSPKRQSFKRPYSCIDEGAISKPCGDVTMGSSSTPLSSKMSERLSKNERGVSRISIIRRRSVLSNRRKSVILATPKFRSRTAQNARKIRLRQFVLQSAKKKQKKRVAEKKAVKKNAKGKVEKAKQAPAKRAKIVSTANSTDFFEEIPPIKKVKNEKTAPDQPPAVVHDANQFLDLKAISDDDLKQSFQANFTQLKKMFEDYELQEDAKVKKADDYSQMDMMSLLEEDQIQTMFEMLYSQLVDANINGSVSFANLFFELMVPEWTLAIFMEKYDMDRKSAIEKIQQQSYWQDNQVDDSEILATTQNSFDEDA